MSFVHSLALLPVRNRVAAILFALFVAIIAAAGISKLSISADNRVFFSKTNEHRVALDLFEQRYASQANAFVVISARDGDLFTEERLSILHQMTEDAWKFPYVTRVDSITNAIYLSSDEDGVIIESMIDPMLDNGIEPTEIRQRVLSDTLLVDRLISPDAKTAAINISTQYPRTSTTAPGELVTAIAAQYATYDLEGAGLDLFETGRVPISYAFSSASKDDLKTLTPLAYLVIAVMLGVLLRSPLAAAAVYLSAVLAAVSTLGTAGWIGYQINAATSTTPTILLTLGVATLMHLATSYLYALRIGEARQDAAIHSVRKNLVPVALTLSTTAIGFLTLNYADAPPFGELGNIAAIGAFFILFFGFVFLPACFALFPIATPKRRSLVEGLVSKFTDFILAKRQILFWVMPVFFIVISAGMGRIVLDDRYTEYFHPRYDIRADSDEIESRLTGLDQVEFDVGLSADQSILTPTYFAVLQDFEAFLRTHEKVQHVTTMAETFKRLNLHLHGNDPAFDRIPEDPEMLAQSLLLYEMSLPYGRDLNDAITIDRSRSRVMVGLRYNSTSDVQKLRDAGEAWLANPDNTHGLTIDGNGTGLAVMMAYLSKLNIETMTVGTILALILISVILIFAFRSLAFGLVSLVPNLLPVLMAFGVWGFLIGKIGVAVSAVGAVTLGIIVDDTVHLIWRYLEARRNGDTKEDAIRAMFAHVGRPMLTSTIVLVSGFCIIAASGFHITSTLGALSAVTITIALIADWFFLPSLLMFIDRRDVIVENSETAATLGSVTNAAAHP